MNKLKRLEYLRGEIRAERISYEEIAELQSLVEYIKPNDVELLEWAGVPEREAEMRSMSWNDLERKRKKDKRDELKDTIAIVIVVVFFFGAMLYSLISFLYYTVFFNYFN